MDNAAQDSQYQRIIELVYDEERIVTCVSAAAELKISPHKAKDLLQSVVKNYEKSKLEQLHITYLLSGTLKDTKGAAVYLVKEEDLNDRKSIFSNVISEIIYSIQKGKQIDFSMIASVDSTHNVHLGPLVSKNCIKRNMKVKKLPPPSTNGTKEKVPLKKLDSFINVKSKTEVQASSKEPSKPSQKPFKKNGGIASFFSQSAAKTTPVSKSEINDKKKTETIEAASTSAIQNPVCDEKKPSIDETGDGKMDVDIQIEKSVVEKVQKQKGNKKRKKENKNNIPIKKRRRIQEVCDSDSSDMFDGEESEDIIEKSDEEPEHVPVVKPTPAPKNKRRKAVDKTYVDEDGFIVTNTEYIYESVSESEEPEPVKLKEKNNSFGEKKSNKVDSQSDVKPSTTKGKSNKKPVSGKQPTLMSFFKKS